MLGVFAVVLLYLQSGRHHTDISTYHNARFTQNFTGTFYSKFSSSCQPLSFLDCGNCPGRYFYLSQVRQPDLPTGGSCLNTRNTNTNNLLHLLNFLALYWTFFFFAGLSHMVLATVFSKVLCFYKLGSMTFWFYVKMAFELSNNSSSNLNSTLTEVFEINLSNEN